MKRTPTNTFEIAFDTLSMPGSILATRVILTQVLIRDDKTKMRIDLSDHPLYSFLYEYCKNNPPRIED